MKDLQIKHDTVIMSNTGPQQRLGSDSGGSRSVLSASSLKVLHVLGEMQRLTLRAPDAARPKRKKKESEMKNAGSGGGTVYSRGG